MARKTTAQAAPSGDAPAPSALSEQADATSPAAAAAAPGTGEAGGTEPAATLPGPPDAPAPAPEPDTRERVKALVLHDSIYGKCGEVREFDADHVSALKGAGYIDPHPNAVESAGG
ncbi:hypothetical protein ELS24_20815 [Achromobacter spanius]|uniref:hypothetical protein n=1 Tax=Achromobacter spanius TaxID=217203 RepID=UPI000F8F851D|nr:hypothetical protein [Achromobacter spanius]AZS80674.1 hypothetical protein ELS24_20815 [Achromobacter spanius]